MLISSSVTYSLCSQQLVRFRGGFHLAMLDLPLAFCSERSASPRVGAPSAWQLGIGFCVTCASMQLRLVVYPASPKPVLLSPLRCPSPGTVLPGHTLPTTPDRLNNLRLCICYNVPEGECLGVRLGARWQRSAAAKLRFGITQIACFIQLILCRMVMRVPPWSVEPCCQLVTREAAHSRVPMIGHPGSRRNARAKETDGDTGHGQTHYRLRRSYVPSATCPLGQAEARAVWRWGGPRENGWCADSQQGTRTRMRQSRPRRPRHLRLRRQTACPSLPEVHHASRGRGRRLSVSLRGIGPAYQE